MNEEPDATPPAPTAVAVVPGGPTIPAEVIDLLGRLRHACGLVQVAIPTDQLTARTAAEFAAACEHTARSVLQLCDQPPALVDDEFRAATLAMYRANVSEQ
ncbi:MAG: hypothetical protein M3443_12270 [Actinomycetota bacterium]|nr:hypothetical protein [Actinomycetota bacterium]